MGSTCFNRNGRLVHVQVPVPQEQESWSPTTASGTLQSSNEDPFPDQESGTDAGQENEALKVPAMAERSINDEWLDDEMLVPREVPGIQEIPSPSWGEGQTEGAEASDNKIDQFHDRIVDELAPGGHQEETELDEADMWKPGPTHVNHMTEEDIQALQEDGYDYEDDHVVLLSRPEMPTLTSRRLRRLLAGVQVQDIRHSNDGRFFASGPEGKMPLSSSDQIRAPD
jgi:hypothetical protein